MSNTEKSPKNPQLPFRNDVDKGSNHRPAQSEAILSAIAKYGGRAVTLNEIMSVIGEDYKKSSTRVSLFFPED